MKRLPKYLLAMVLPLCVLLARPIVPALTAVFGQEVRLATEPFDPRDLFRGDYVELRFAIESVSADLLPAAAKNEGNEVDERDVFLYVVLSADAEGIHVPVGTSFSPPLDGLYIRGRLVSRFRERKGSVEVEYGPNLSRFYVKENTGLELERAAREGRVVASAKIWRGRVLLESLETRDR